MCGICGYATPEDRESPDRETLARMTDLLVHRGPDGEGYHVDEGVGLGMRRLSIVDLAETGDQPIPNEDGTVMVICNGEIYNAPELQRELEGRGHRFRGHSDAEVIVHLYEESGADCLSRLRGMFGLALWDRTRRTLLLARDRLGIKPLYYGLGTDGTLYFGSEAKSVLTSGAVDRTLDPSGLSDLLYFSAALFDRTLWKGVSQLQAGERLLYSRGRIQRETWWDLELGPTSAAGLPGSEGEWAEAVAAKLQESVRIHLRGDVPVAAWLSPGIDSSAVASMASAELGGLQTFSLGFKGSRFDELGHQRALDEFPEYRLRGERIEFGETYLEHLPAAIWHREQPVHHQYSYHILGAATRGRFKVALTGQGSDEVFGGYPWYRTDRRWRVLYGLPAPLRALLARKAPRLSTLDRRAISQDSSISPQRFAALQWTGWPGLRPLLRPELRAEVAQARANVQGFRPPEGFESWDRFHQLLYVEAKTRLPGFINLGLDASSMSQSIEPRLPFLDHEFVELCTRVPPHLRYRTQEKHVLRKAVEPHLPAEIAWRDKRGLSSPDPMWKKEWGAAPEFVDALLSESVIAEKGYFDLDAVRPLLEARNGSGLGRTLAAIVGFHMWDDHFVRSGGTERDATTLPRRLRTYESSL